MLHAKSVFTKFFIAFAAIALTAAYSSAATTTIYHEDFNGGSDVELHGQEPTTGPEGVTWQATKDSAAPYWADGSFAADGFNRSGYLPFTPEDGYEYTLDIRCSGLGSNTKSEYFSIGYLNATDPEGEHWTGTNVGLIHHRYSQAEPYSNLSTLGDMGWGDGLAYPGDAGVTGGADITFRTVLDTTNSEQWTATWYGKADGATEFSLLRSSSDVDMANIAPEINAIGFGEWSDPVGHWESLTLTQNQVIPEPTTALFALFGLLTATFHRSRRR